MNEEVLQKISKLLADTIWETPKEISALSAEDQKCLYLESHDKTQKQIFEKELMHLYAVANPIVTGAAFGDIPERTFIVQAVFSHLSERMDDEEYDHFLSEHQNIANQYAEPIRGYDSQEGFPISYYLAKIFASRVGREKNILLIRMVSGLTTSYLTTTREFLDQSKKFLAK